jgi:ring-1,2-phenylacetyl-CoA epoxidase subunit PaaA
MTHMTPVWVESAAAAQEMPAEYREILIHQLLVHTEGELSGADAYRLGLTFAPNAEELQVLYASAADEVGHYIIGAKLLADLGHDASHLLRSKVAERTHCPGEFMLEHGNWAERGLTSMLVESAGLEHLVEFRDSSYRPIAAVAEQLIREESVHIAHGKRIVRALCESDAGRQAVQAVLDRKWGQCLDLFGSSTSKRSLLFLKWGLRTRPNEAARQDWIARTRPKLAELGLVAPEDHLNRRFM